MTFEQYKEQLQSQLERMAGKIKPSDYIRIQQSLNGASSHGQLDAISLRLNFHQFRVDERDRDKED